MATTQYLRYPVEGGGGSGTVTSVGLALPASVFSVTGSPVTSSGTLTGSFTNQTANTVFAGPTSGGAAVPAFRALVLADLPSGIVTNVTATTPLSSTGGATPDISIQVANGSQSGYLSSTDWTTFNSKQPAGSYITALTGDASATGPGSATLTLATVNANTGTFGAANSVGSFTVNGKGLITAASSISIAIAQSQVTNLVTDLAGKQPTGNYITALTGDVTAAGPGSVSASLVATTNSTLTTLSSLSLPFSQVTGTVPISQGGTGQTGQTAAFDALAPTTTKGDLIVSNGTDNVRQAVGSNTFVLTADSTQSTGIKWAAVPPPAFVGTRVSYAASTQNLPSGSQTSMNFDTVDFDTSSSWDGTNFWYLAPFTGYYAIVGCAELDTIAAGQAQALLYVNGSAYSSLGNMNSGGPPQINGGDIIYMTAGDYVQLVVFQNSGVTVAVAPSGVVYNHLSFQYLGT